MRESDQAALLTGAVELARGEAALAGNGSYNYDKQYMSYWFVAAVLKVSGAVGADGTLAEVVRVANRAAAILFAAALILVVSLRREWTWHGVGLLVCVLLSPVVAFSGLLLSPNLISGAFLLFLVARLGFGGRRGAAEGFSGDGLECPGLMGWARAAGAGLLSFAAVAARQDAILLMPLLVALVVPWESWKSPLAHPLTWSMGVGCVLALMVGRWIDPSPTPLPQVFFSAPTFMVYLVGGLGGCLIALVVFSWHQFRGWSGGRWLVACAVLVPLVFYCFMLFTPRHLFASVLALAATLFLPGGEVLWRAAVSTMGGRILVLAAVIATLVPWVVGVRMTGWTSGRVVMTDSTPYPTTDGFWPMGAYGSFFVRLGRSCERPIDHNQEVWEAWASMEADQLPSGSAAVISSGLISFGRFALSWHGRPMEHKPARADYILFDDRTVAKRQLGVDQHEWHADDKVGRLLTSGRVAVVGRKLGRAVVCWTPEGAVGGVDEGLSLRVALSQSFGGNDFRQARWEMADWLSRNLRGYHIVLAARSKDALLGFSTLAGESLTVAEIQSEYDPGTWFVAGISSDEIARVRRMPVADNSGLWIACGTLPEFMDVRTYAK